MAGIRLFTQLADIRQSISHCKHTIKNIDKWDEN